MYWIALSLVSLQKLQMKVCKSCRGKFTGVHWIGLLIIVIHRSVHPAVFWMLLSSMLITLIKSYVNTWRNAILILWQNSLWVTNVTEGNVEHVKWEAAIIYEILGSEINGTPKPGLMLYQYDPCGEEKPPRKLLAYELAFPTSAFSSRWVVCTCFRLWCNKSSQT